MRAKSIQQQDLDKFKRFFLVKIVLLLVCFFSSIDVKAQCVTGNTGGQVWKDFNSNGIQETAETAGLIGVTVTAYDCNGVAVATTTTDYLGQYTFGALSPAPSASTPYRIEFSGLPVGYNPSFNGTTGRTDVQFITAPSCTIKFGVLDATDYCQSNPPLVTTCFLTGFANTPDAAVVGFNEGLTATTGYKATIDQVGSVWGIASVQGRNKAFTSAFLKRHVGLGPLGLGGIYVIDNIGTGTTSVSTLIDLDLFYNLGTIDEAARDLTDPYRSYDIEAYAKIGKVGIGDIDYSEAEKALYAVNLNTKEVIRIDLTNYLATGTLPTASNLSVLPAYTLPCTNGSSRPFGLKYRNGKLYLGVICDASTGGTAANLSATVLAYNGTAWQTALPTFPMDYKRGATNINWYNSPGEYNPWIDVFNTAYDLSYPQPMLSDIEFDEYDNMILGFMDRTGHQMAIWNYAPIAGTTKRYEAITAGEILKAAYSGGSYVIESGGTTVNGGGSGSNGEGIGGGEYYGGDDVGYIDTNTGIFVPQHQENSNGGLAYILGKSELYFSAFDAEQDTYYSGGVRKVSNITGGYINALNLYTADTTASLGKGNGIGDIEVICNTAPLQIGNYVWIDTDKDGVQDPCELPLSNITVSLWKGTTQIASTTTNTSGEYYFSSKSILGANWIGTGADTTLLPATTYEVRIAMNQSGITTSHYTLTTANVTTNSGNDQNDSDASILGNTAVISFTTSAAGSVNHTYDFGFYSSPPINLVLSKTVDSSSVSVEGRQVTFTVKVKNISLTNATGVKVQVNAGVGFTFVSANPSVSYASATGLWTVGTVNAGDSAILQLTVTVDSLGVNYCTAEISAADQIDSNSTPNNNVRTEDDIAGVCVTVPVPICPNQLYNAVLPSGLTNIQWYKNGTVIAGATNQTLSITEVGDYTFSANELTCSVEGCCPIRMIQGTCPLPCKPVICLPVVVVRQ